MGNPGLTLHAPLPCYSPPQYPLNHFHSENNVLPPNPFSYQRAPQNYEQKSEDLILQIFNSIKSNHSMSPIPQLMSPPPVLDFHTSQHSSDHGSARADTLEQAFYEKLDQDIACFLKSVDDNL